MPPLKTGMKFGYLPEHENRTNSRQRNAQQSAPADRQKAALFAVG
jgi:hypothetical protein